MKDSKDGQVEARRILERMARETAPGGASFITRIAKDEHETAAHADPYDPIEYWGMRIGRALSVLITVGLLIWIASYLFGGR